MIQIDYTLIIKNAEERASRLKELMSLLEASPKYHGQMQHLKDWLADLQHVYKKIDDEGRELLPKDINRWLHQEFSGTLNHLLGHAESGLPGLRNLNEMFEEWVPEEPMQPPAKSVTLVPVESKETAYGFLRINFYPNWDRFLYPEGIWVAQHPGFSAKGIGHNPTEALIFLEAILKDHK